MKRILTIGIILLFIGMSISSSTGFNVEKKSQPKLYIDGPTNGKAGEGYIYTFNFTAPEEFKYFLYVEWGDGTDTGWIGSFYSNTDVNLSHSWNKQGNYIIWAFAKDLYDERRCNATLEVTMPKNKPFSFILNLLDWLFESFPLLYKLVQFVE